jgi:hypothetical protein
MLKRGTVGLLVSAMEDGTLETILVDGESRRRAGLTL